MADFVSGAAPPRPVWRTGLTNLLSRRSVPEDNRRSVWVKQTRLIVFTLRRLTRHLSCSHAATNHRRETAACIRASGSWLPGRVVPAPIPLTTSDVTNPWRSVPFAACGLSRGSCESFPLNFLGTHLAKDGVPRVFLVFNRIFKPNPVERCSI